MSPVSSTTAVLLHLALLAPASTNDLFLDRAFLPADAADLRRSAGPPSVSSLAGEPVGPTCLADMDKGKEFHGDIFSDPHAPVEWYDAAKVARGNDVFNRKSASIGLSWTLSLVVGLSYEPMLDVLIFTNESDTVAKDAIRYAKTGIFLSKWCMGDPMNPNSSAFKSVQAVRNYHETVRKEIAPVLAPISGEKEWMTQYDMGIVQTAFLSAFASTQTFGFTFTDEEQDDFIYLWRVIGRQLGIDDRFNPSTLGTPAMKTIIDDVFHQLIIPSLTNPPAEYGEMAGAFIGVMNLACLGFPCFTVASVVGLSIIGYGEPMPAALSTADKIRANLQMTLIRAFAKVPFFEPLVSGLIVRLLEQVDEPVIPESQGSPLRHASSACPALARRAPDLHAAHNEACAPLPAGHPADPEWCHTSSPPTDDGAHGLEGGLPVKIKLLLMAPAATALAMTAASAAVLALKAHSLLA